MQALELQVLIFTGQERQSTCSGTENHSLFNKILRMGNFVLKLIVQL